MTNATTAKPRRTMSRRRRLLFALLPLAGILLLGEIGIRLFRAPLHFGSFRQLRIDLYSRAYPAVPDPQLGYAPKPGFHSADNHWGTMVGIDADGMRENGAPPPPSQHVVAAVGDSFTFGDQVDDDATWPAWLEQLLQKRVVNGGVFGYSFTQSILRAEQMLERYPVDTLVVSLIPDDLVRSELKKRYTPLPWFGIEQGRLVLHPVPAQEQVDPGEQSARDWKNLLGCSALVDAVLANTVKRWWIENEKEVRVPELAGRGLELGKLLVERIAGRCRERGVRLLLVLQDQKPEDMGKELLRHAEAHGVQTLDLASRFQAAKAADPSVQERWFAGHMTRAGNRWAAEQIAAVLQAPR